VAQHYLLLTEEDVAAKFREVYTYEEFRLYSRCERFARTPLLRATQT
jgi:hypothetical protein